MNKLDRSAFWTGRRVLVTGHSGFKGKWLSRMLKYFGAEVAGISRDPIQNVSIGATRIDAKREGWTDLDIIGDVTDRELLLEIEKSFLPQTVIHLAAQSIVSVGYTEPFRTLNNNFLSTLAVLDLAKNSKEIKAVLVITSDKVYENTGSLWGFRETDALGGDDPYSASKAIVELLVKSYANSFLKKNGKLLATARAGNVIGGGDFGTDRLVPDLIRAWLKKESLPLRHPGYIRPWQYVLEPLSGYLSLVEHMYTKRETALAYNFGPPLENNTSVSNLLFHFERFFNVDIRVAIDSQSAVAEMRSLRLDTSRALFELGYVGQMSLSDIAERTALVYKKIFSDGLAPKIFDEEIEHYFSRKS